jgi:hypothetical protein
MSVLFGDCGEGEAVRAEVGPLTLQSDFYWCTYLQVPDEYEGTNVQHQSTLKNNIRYEEVDHRDVASTERHNLNLRSPLPNPCLQ